MPGPLIPETKLRALVRERIECGALPILLVRDVDAGYGNDESCSACGESILEKQIEYEVRETVVGRLALHMMCYALWQLECAKRIQNAGGDSA
jgi:hypothetical protein